MYRFMNRNCFTALLSVLTLCAPVLAQDDLRSRVANAPMLEVENVAEPMRVAKHYAPLLVPNPDGKTYDAVLRYYETYWGPHTLLFIDLGTGKVKRQFAGTALPDQHRYHIGPDGRLYQHWSMSGKGNVLTAYDPATDEWNPLVEHLNVGGEFQPIVTGTDGMLYGAGAGGKAQVTAYQYDPKTGKVVNYPVMGPSHSPDPSWAYTIAADDDFIYIASGKVPWYLVAYNKKTGKDMVLFEQKKAKGYISVSQGRYGCTAMRRGDGADERFWLYQGKAIPKQDPKETPPWTEPEQLQPWVTMPAKPQLGIAKLSPKSDGWCELWYRNPGSEEWHAIGFEIPTYPVPIYRVTAIGDGRLCGSGGNYTGNFIYDPKPHEARHPGMLHLSHYCSTALDGKVYMSGYPSSALFVWDPQMPWTANTSAGPTERPIAETSPASNPRRVAYMHQKGDGTVISGCHKMWTACTGGDGKAYFGGRWYRDGEQGGMAWWDPATKRVEGLYKPFGNYQIMRIKPAGENDRYIVISTKACRDQLNNINAPDEAKIFVFDTRIQKIVNSFVPLKGANQTGHIAPVGGNLILGITYNPADRLRDVKPEELSAHLNGREKDYGIIDETSILYKVDILTGKVLWTKVLPYPAGFRTNENFANQDGFDFRRGPDGFVWTWTGARFSLVNPEKAWHYEYLNCRIVEDEPAPNGFRLEDMNVTLARIDPKDGTVHVVGKVPNTGEMAFIGRDLYLSGGPKYLDGYNTHLRRLKDIVPE